MKKILFITCLCLFATLCLNAQTTTFDNLNANPLSNKAITWTSSNYGSGFGHRIINSDPGGQTLLNFQGRHDSTTWSDIMTLTSNGNVGIGTSNTNFKAHIVSTISAQALKVENINGGYANVDVSSNRSSGNIGGFRFFTNGDTYATTELNTIVNGDFYISTGTGSNVPSTRLAVTTLGNVGIGTTAPNAKLEVTDEIRVRLATNNVDKNVARILPIGYSGITGAMNWTIRGAYQYTTGINTNSVGGDLDLIKSLDRNTILATTSDGTSIGNVGIGTTTPDAKLTVKGLIHSQEVKVTATAGADFVFENDYNLPTLKKVEEFIKANKHLPEIPSAKEMQTNGLYVAEMNTKLLQKIEELTLYTINQEKRIETLEKENTTLKTQEERIAQLEEKIKLLLNKK